MQTDELRNTLRDVPDFPSPGILFKDITPVLANPSLFEQVIDWMVECLDSDIHAVVGIEARGFIFASPVALRLGTGFVPARKPGKLPYKTVAKHYQLEYGAASLEIHADAIKPGMRVAVIDDVLATGGTAAATVALCESLGAQVTAVAVLAELEALGARARLGVPVHSLVTF